MNHYVPFEKAKSRISLVASMAAQGFNRVEIAHTLTSYGIPGVGRSGTWDRHSVERAEMRWEASGLPVDEGADVFYLLSELRWELAELPELDRTDGGFNWTPEELSEASLLASRLVGYKATHGNKIFQQYMDYQEGQLGLNHS